MFYGNKIIFYQAFKEEKRRTLIMNDTQDDQAIKVILSRSVDPLGVET